MYHKSVLLKESVEGLNISGSDSRRDGIYVDATLGGGGHCRGILNELGERGRLIVFDKDEDASKNVPKDKRVTFIRNNFRFIANYIELLSFIEGKKLRVDGIIADLGVSSHQFDTAERGFSYRFDAPLDMRMNRDSGLSAKEIVNTYSKERLTKILSQGGELLNAKAIAGEIVNNQGEINSTFQLCKILEKFYTPQTERKFLSKVFQALRIEVNSEIEALEDLLKGFEKILQVGGRVSIITYHSLEDRIVKNILREGKQRGIYELINKKPIVPKEEEIADNTRSRSAKLRVAEKVKE